MSKRLAALLLAALLMTGTSKAEKALTFTFVGDCTIGSEDRLINSPTGFYQAAETKGYAYFFAKVLDLFKEDDLTVANFEGVLKNNKTDKMNKTYCFRGPTDFAQILPLGSVEAVNIDNNHTVDYGEGGVKSTVAALTEAGVVSFNDRSPYIFEKDGIRVAFLGITLPQLTWKRADYKEQIAQLKAEGVSAVIFTPHIGQEYQPYHNEQQTMAAHRLINAGADLYVAHHPHVIQGVESYKNRYILYSLGNFVFGGNSVIRDTALNCLIARVTMTFDDSGAYLGQQLRLYAAHSSGDATLNDYQPRLAEGEEAQAVFALVDADSVGQPEPVAASGAYRDYVYLEALWEEPVDETAD